MSRCIVHGTCCSTSAGVASKSGASRTGAVDLEGDLSFKTSNADLLVRDEEAGDRGVRAFVPLVNTISVDVCACSSFVVRSILLSSFATLEGPESLWSQSSNRLTRFRVAGLADADRIVAATCTSPLLSTSASRSTEVAGYGWGSRLQSIAIKMSVSRSSPADMPTSGKGERNYSSDLVSDRARPCRRAIRETPRTLKRRATSLGLDVSAESYIVRLRCGAAA